MGKNEQQKGMGWYKGTEDHGYHSLSGQTVRKDELYFIPRAVATKGIYVKATPPKPEGNKKASEVKE